MNMLLACFILGVLCVACWFQYRELCARAEGRTHDPLTPARGILTGVICGLFLWLALAIFGWVVVS